MKDEASTRRDHGLRKVNSKVEKTEGRNAYNIGKFWLFIAFLKGIKVNLEFHHFTNGTVQTLIAIIEWIGELNVLRPKWCWLIALRKDVTIALAKTRKKTIVGQHNFKWCD